MSVQEQINNIIDETLIFLAKNNYKTEIDRALKQYKSPFAEQGLDLDIEQGFNNWLIHDYQKSDKSYIISDYFKNKNIDDANLFNMINKSVLSIFKISIQNKNIVFKDIITQADYVIETEQEFNDGDVIKIRVYPFDNKFYIVDLGTYYSAELEPTIRKSVMSKYNEYCSANEPIKIDVFVKKHSILIYHLTNIIDYYESELSSEDEVSVFVATYAVKDRVLAIDKLVDSNSFQFSEQYDDELILVLLSDGAQVAEAVVTVNQIEIESNSSVLLSYSKAELEKVVGDTAVFVKEKELFLEDLI